LGSWRDGKALGRNLYGGFIMDESLEREMVKYGVWNRDTDDPIQ
jgi:hypothetical protein